MKYKVSELSKLLGVNDNTIRQYELEGFLKPERDRSNYRWYCEYDISKAAMIRLYTKCGFSRSEIRTMMGADTDIVADMCGHKIDEIDLQIKRLKGLRRWLNGNMAAISLAEALRGRYEFVNGVPLAYIVYCRGVRLYKEKERILAINKFIDMFSEISIIQLFKLEEILKGALVPYCGWAVRTDILKSAQPPCIDENNPYIETYPSKRSLCGVIETSAEMAHDIGLYKSVHKEFFHKAFKYISDNGCVPDGDIMEIMINSLGNKRGSLIYIPIKNKEPH